MTTATPTAPAERLYLTPEQVAALLQVSPKTVYRWAAQDATMPTLRVGGVVRFPRERVLRWLRDREQGPGRPRRSRQPLRGEPQAPAASAIPATGNGSCAAACAAEAIALELDLNVKTVRKTLERRREMGHVVNPPGSDPLAWALTTRREQG